MRRLLLTLGLLFIIYVLGNFIVSELKPFVENASLLITGVDISETKERIRAYVEQSILNGNELKDAEIAITTAYIDGDTEKDLIATITSEQTCGSGGCITTIFLRTDENTFTPIPFAYAVKELTVEHSVSQGMHDLRINNDPSNIMVWDGNRYVLNSVE